MSSLSTLPKGDSAWLLRKSIQRIMQQVSVLETNIGSSTTGNSADTQVIFNDAGTLRGDTGLTYDKSADRLSFGAGICYGLLTSASATITGDLTVDTSTLKVDSANNRVGIGTASPSKPLEVYNTTESTVWANTTTGIALLRAGGTGGDFYFGIDNSTGGGFGQGNYSRLIYSTGAYPIVFSSNASERYRIASDGIATWSNVGGVAGTAMTLNATGLGVGTSPSYKIHALSTSPDVARFERSGAGGAARIQLVNGSGTVWYFRNAVNDLVFNYEGTDLVTFGSSGNVGIGVTPSAWTTTFGLKASQVYNSALASNGTSGFLTNNAYYAGAGYTPTYISASSTPAQGILFNSTGANDIRFVIGAAGTAGNTIAGFSTAAMTLDASGNLSLANGNLVMGTSGKGIDFSATSEGSGTMTSELLNDYEEGTWTASLLGGTTNPTTPVTATGTYTKVGRQVTVDVYFNNVTTTGASGSAYVAGLPFTTATRSVGSVGLYNFDLNTGTGVFADVTTTNIYLISVKTNAAWADVLHNAGANRYLRVTVTYFV